MFGGLLENGRKLQLVDLNLVVMVRSPCLLQESTQLAQYIIGEFNIGGVTRNPPIPQI